MFKKITLLTVTALLIISFLNSCKKDSKSVVGSDINTASKVSIDRFSTAAGHLQVRTSTNGLPAANAPVNFDNKPFITTGLNPSGVSVTYYNFDVQPTTPAPIYNFYTSGSSTPVSGQNNVVGVIPGQSGYNDFWVVNKVTVPNNYVPNSLTSEAEVLASGYTITPTTTIVNCPIVPFGSTASKSFTAGVASTLTLGWYNSQAVAYFTFSEAPLSTTSANLVPTSPIYVMFNIDPSQANPNSGPASGFEAETTDSTQTHNVISTIPGQASYSPLWAVQVISNVNFNSVNNLSTATSFPNSPAGANVNCPVVK